MLNEIDKLIYINNNIIATMVHCTHEHCILYTHTVYTNNHKHIIY